MSENIHFRKAVPPDAEPIKEIAKRVIRHNYVSFLGTEATSAFIDSGTSDKEIDDGLDRCMVMVSDDVIVGFAITDKDWLHVIMVDVPFQGQGYGSQLLKYTEAELFSHYETVHLQTFKENADTARFYLKNNWEIAGWQDVPELCLIMLLFEKSKG